MRALQALLAMLGFGLDLTGVFDARTVSVVKAFQRHYRPELIDGIADLSTMMTLKAVLQATTINFAPSSSSIRLISKLYRSMVAALLPP